MNNPTPKKTKTKVDTFEDTLFLMDLYKHKMQLAKYEKKVKMFTENGAGSLLASCAILCFAQI